MTYLPYPPMPPATGRHQRRAVKSRTTAITDGVIAPWSQEQAQSANEFQASGVFQPFRCPNTDVDPHPVSAGLLVGSREGWTCSDCGYRQNWAHQFMLDREWEVIRDHAR